MEAEGENTRPVGLVILVPHPGYEPPSDLDEASARAIWSAITAPWHPAILSLLGQLPEIEPIDAPSPPEPGRLRVIPEGMSDRVPEDGDGTDAALAPFVARGDRLEIVAGLRDRLTGSGEGGGLPPEDGGRGDELAGDFLALGTGWMWLRDLTAAMGHGDTLDADAFTRETLQGARAWAAKDWSGASGRLRAAFELLTQARERFYPMDAYAIEICLLDPSTPPQGLHRYVEDHVATTFLAPGMAIEALAKADPELIPAILRGVEGGWIDLIGGPYDEADEPLLPLESVFWRYRKGNEVYRQHFDDRGVETFARRRFGLYPQLPQIVQRFGFRFGLHTALDHGRFPIRSEAKRLWDAPDGSPLEVLNRVPLAGDRAASGLRLPWLLADSMNHDAAGTLVLAHWPEPVAGWVLDARRIASYSPLLARWVTVGDYFHYTDRPYETFRAKLDDYEYPYLRQSCGRPDSGPISRRARHHRLRARLDAASSLVALTTALAGPGADKPSGISPAEELLERSCHDEAESAIAEIERAGADRLAEILNAGEQAGRPGFLVINPTRWSRRAPVLLPYAAADLRPEGPLKAAQFLEDGTWGVVEVPAFGYAWVPRDSDPSLPMPEIGKLAVRDRVLTNGLIEAEIDVQTGGIRSLRGAGEPSARLAQRLVVAGAIGIDGQPGTSAMIGEGFDVDYAGPALVQAIATGRIEGPGGRILARYRQRFRLWALRPVLELDIELSEIDPDWAVRAGTADPWQHHLACRWAWSDPNASLRRTHFLGAFPTLSARPETPDAIEISAREARVTLGFGGLAHHQRHGARMLDTILLAGTESCRQFSFAIALDNDQPHAVAMGSILAPLVIPCDGGPPPQGTSGWFFHLDARSVIVTRAELVEEVEEGRGWGIAFHLMETAGHATRCRLRCFRDPTWARQTDFQGNLVVDLPIDGDAILIDLTPHEMVRIGVTLAE